MFTLEHFIDSSKWFYAETSKIEDGWSLEYDEIQDYKYLRKKSDFQETLSSSSSTHENTNDITKLQENQDDETVLADEIYYISDHHFLYSFSYNVPVIFFNIYNKDGSLVKLEDVWRLIRERCPMTNTMEHNQFWSFVSQQDHPVLNRPFLCLHPCHSNHFMAQISQLHTSHRQYFLAWITSIAPYALLELSIKHGNLAKLLST